MYDPSKIRIANHLKNLTIKNQNMMQKIKGYFYSVNAVKENKCMMEQKVSSGFLYKQRFMAALRELISFLLSSLMGVGTSQDKASQVSDEESSKNGPKSSHAEGKGNQSSKRVVLPHNCEDILKHADSPVDVSDSNITEMLHAGVFLNQKRKKYWVDKQSNCNCFMIFAQSLSITWAEDRRFWNWPVLKESSDEHLAVAELLSVCWLEVHGKFEVKNLTPGQLYEVVFVVMMKDPAYGWEVPVNLRLTLPDGSRQEHKENLMEKPRGVWIEIPAGEIKSSADKTGETEFSLYEYEGGEWKRGLLLKGVKIQPKSLRSVTSGSP